MMGLRVDHTAVAVTDLDAAVECYSSLLGGPAVERLVVLEQGVHVAFLELDGTAIELLCPLRPDTPVGRFLARRGEGLHHVGVAVPDIRAELDRLRADGVPLIDDEPREGAHGLVAFVHPSGARGVLIELVERAHAR